MALSRLQISLLLGLLAITLLSFQRVSLLAPVANMLAIPLFSIVVVPAILAGSLLHSLGFSVGSVLLELALTGIRWLLLGLFLLQQSSFSIDQFVEPLTILVAAVGAVYVLVPPNMPARKVAFIALVAVLCWRAPSLPRDCAQLIFFDVGHGQAVLARTRSIAVLYDLGPRSGVGQSTATRTLLPAFEALGVQRIDHLVLSRGDPATHAGARDMSNAVDVNQRWASVANRGFKRCSRGQGFVADGVAFEFLHPDPNGIWNGNDAACVLEIRAGQQRALLPGNISGRAEWQLILGGQLRPISVLLVPHYGSRNASRPAFVEQLQPQHVVFSVAAKNRWNHPDPAIVRRWQQSGAKAWRTDRRGAITATMCADNASVAVGGYRDRHRRYWHR